MAEKVVTQHSSFIYTKDFMSYEFAKNHPFNPLRIKLTYELLRNISAIKESHIVSPQLASEEDLLLGHSEGYVNFVKSLNCNNVVNEERSHNYGIGTEDTPIFDNMHQAGLIVVGATLSAVEQVLTNKAKHSLNLGGGLHHALYGKASGFCIYNDVVIAIKHIVKNYNKKVLYIDTDAHHGDGVQWAFYDDPQVCTLSIHETGRYLFPGTGAIHERGSGIGFGFTFNLPVDAFTEDDSWIYCYTEAFEKIIDYFKPDIIITQNGADGHHYDPLTHLSLTMKTYQAIPKLAHRLAHEYCNGKWVALGGGGYDIFRVVPRAWASIWLEMIEYNQILGKLPHDWVQKWQKNSNNEIPDTWHDEATIVNIIPRKDEITDKNKMTLKNSLYSISEDQVGNRYFFNR